MERMVVVLFCIAMVVGLFGGVAISYLVYQPQLQQLENELRVCMQPNRWVMKTGA